MRSIRTRHRSLVLFASRQGIFTIIMDAGCKHIGLLVLIVLVGGCATDWQKEGSLVQGVQTELHVESDPQGRAYVNNKYVGNTPLKVPLEYGQLIDRRVRKVSYWETNPGTSLFVSIVSFGLYLPFSAIPVETESGYIRQNVFKDNVFSIQIEAEGYEKWQENITCQGENTILLKRTLKRISGQ